MANAKYEALFATNNHKVGVINTSWVKYLVNGAIVKENTDNYEIVELDGFDAEGNRKCKALTDTTKKGLLVCTVEEDALYFDVADIQGNYVDFYNAQGEIARLAIQEEWVRFETNNYTGTPAVGGFAYFDATAKKFTCVATETAEYTGAGNRYEIVAVDTDFGANLGLAEGTIRLECRA